MNMGELPSVRMGQTLQLTQTQEKICQICITTNQPFNYLYRRKITIYPLEIVLPLRENFVLQHKTFFLEKASQHFFAPDATNIYRYDKEI